MGSSSSLKICAQRARIATTSQASCQKYCFAFVARRACILAADHVGVLLPALGLCRPGTVVAVLLHEQRLVRNRKTACVLLFAECSRKYGFKEYMEHASKRKCSVSDAISVSVGL